MAGAVMTVVVGIYMRELARVSGTLVETIIVIVYQIFAEKEASLTAKI
jgi:hypothetical protein